MAKLVPRQFERVSHLREMTLRVLPHGSPRQAHAVDLSPSGVRIFTAQSLAVGNLVDLTWNNHDSPVKLGGRVIYVKSDESGLAAGVVFDRPLAPEVFRALNGRRA